MTRSTKQAAAVLAGAVTLASAGFAIGSQRGDGSAVARDGADAATRLAHHEHGLTALAERLGVEEGRLRQALEELHDEMRRERPDRDLAERLASELGIDAGRVESALRAQRPHRGGREDLHAAIAAALARELELDASKVRAALEDVRPRPGAERERRTPAAMESALARRLGVSRQRLREAFRSIRPFHGPFGSDLSQLAEALGVERSKLEAALERLREQHEAEHAQRRAAFAEALADKLGVERSTVEDALEDGGPFVLRRGGGPFGGPGRHRGHR